MLLHRVSHPSSLSHKDHEFANSDRLLSKQMYSKIVIPTSQCIQVGILGPQKLPKNFPIQGIIKQNNMDSSLK